MKLRSKITSKFQITIPTEVRKALKLNTSDTLEWNFTESGIKVESPHKPFLKHKGEFNSGSGNPDNDIRDAWTKRMERYSV
jgi:AbrB family looped-hinge helix DNA binding protein